MSVLDILKFPDPRLRQKCQPVKNIGPQEVKLAEDMLETMSEASGIGLSAIQVGRFVRLLTANTSVLFEDSENPRYSTTSAGQLEKQIPQPLVLFNPQITSREGQVVFKEGCLSFPSYYAEVKRSALVEVKGLDRTGKSITVRTDGVLAVCLQHEIDHLNGKLFIDHLSSVKADLLRAEIKKNGYPDLYKTHAS